SGVDYNCDGTGNITITPYDADYTYTLGALEQTGPSANIFTNLAPGNHTITVNYGSECTTEITVNVASGREFSATITNPVNISCFEGTDGSFIINATNFGAGGFEYSLDGGTTFVGPFTTSQTVPSLMADTHNVEVRDVDEPTACTVTLNQVLTEPLELTATASITAPFTCDPNNTGATITVVPGGGTPGYTYSLNGGVYQSSPIFRNVAAGDHTITVMDANLC